MLTVNGEAKVVEMIPFLLERKYFFHILSNILLDNLLQVPIIGYLVKSYAKIFNKK